MNQVFKLLQGGGGNASAARTAPAAPATAPAKPATAPAASPALASPPAGGTPPAAATAAAASSSAAFSAPAAGPTPEQEQSVAMDASLFAGASPSALFDLIHVEQFARLDGDRLPDTQFVIVLQKAAAPTDA